DAEAHHHASLQEVGQPTRLLLRRSIFGEGADRSEITELHHVGAARADGGDLLNGDHRVHERAALAAIGLGKANAHETVRAHQFRDVERIARVVGALERILFEVRERETANRVGEGLLLFGEVELHLEFPQTGRADFAACIAAKQCVPLYRSFSRTARPHGRWRPSIAREDGRKRPLGRPTDALKRAVLGIQSSISHPGPRYGIPATHSASLRAFTPVFDGLWTRNALLLSRGGPRGASGKPLLIPGGCRRLSPGRTTLSARRR